MLGGKCDQCFTLSWMIFFQKSTKSKGKIAMKKDLLNNLKAFLKKAFLKTINKIFKKSHETPKIIIKRVETVIFTWKHSHYLIDRFAIHCICLIKSITKNLKYLMFFLNNTLNFPDLVFRLFFNISCYLIFLWSKFWI